MSETCVYRLCETQANSFALYIKVDLVMVLWKHKTETKTTRLGLILSDTNPNIV